ncbi:MAG: response regulator transcription factor [Clostridiales bacterium]|nr:response regulator transcription factor [Clostridiales bacterium]
MRLLLIEDDQDLCAALCVTLKKEGYDAIILDRMLPLVDGLSILQILRKNNITTPIIMVTAMNGINDRIDGLDAGADDYLIKPFDTRELLARIRALVRRPRELNHNEILKYSNFTLNINLHTLTADNKAVTLSNKETNLLEYLIHNKGQILTREQILTRVWGINNDVEDGNLDNYIYLVRRILKMTGCKAQIKTVHSVGYQLVEI